jgi:hypothetical protein
LIGSASGCAQKRLSRRAASFLGMTPKALRIRHLRHCAAQAISHGSPEEAEAMYDELLALIYKHSR